MKEYEVRWYDENDGCEKSWTFYAKCICDACAIASAISGTPDYILEEVTE